MWGGGSERDRNEVINMSFNNFKREVTTEPIDGRLVTKQNNASITDKEGNLLFYTNGCVVTNREHHIMDNRDSINYTAVGYQINADCRFGYNGPQNTWILPDPADGNGYYIMNKPVERYSNDTLGSLGLPEVRMNYVDISENEGLGKVMWKIKVIFRNYRTLSGYNQPIRHADGRDWWFLQMEEGDNLYYKFLIDESGPHLVDTQRIGPKFRRPTSAAGQAKFSPDGWSRHIYRTHKT